ncbi:MAG: DNA primase [Acidimicrobiia bacterium]
MAIDDEDVARVREATDFVALVSEHVALKRVGRRWTGLCPFHAEKSPSFSVNAEEGLYYCFGCGARGDAITFVRNVEHLDFVEAVERLAAKTGIVVRHDSQKATQDRRRKESLHAAMERAVDFYNDRLLSSPDAGAARSYLRSRGYDRSVVEQFRIGWAPSGWDELVRSLKVPEDVLRDTGLGLRSRLGTLIDSFRSRVMFPIFDTGGKPVAFGGRILPGAEVEGPKYKNSPETPIYSKSRTLYALNWAKKDVVDAGEVVVCEGYTDVIAYFLSGVPRAVATCGTALTEEHVRLLKNFAEKRVVLSFDADAAGQAAADRFYAWERKYEIDIAVAALPRGKDPADVARNDPAALQKAVAGARSFLAFRIDRALDASDLRSPEGRARAAEAALEEIRAHPSDIVRREYAGHVAMRCSLPVDQLVALAEKPGKVVVRPAPVRERPTESPEIEALRLAVHHPEEIADRLDPVVLRDPLHQAAFHALASSETLHAAIESSGPEVAQLLQRLAVEEADADPDDVLALLATRAAARVEAEMREEAMRSGDLAAFAEMLTWLRLTREQAMDPETRVEATGQLVAFLVEHEGVRESE